MDERREWDGFSNTFDHILSVLIPEKQGEELADYYKWFKKMVLYNVPHGKRNRGLAVVHTFRLIAEQEKQNVSEEDVELARVLGWVVEFLQAYFLIVDDIVDQSTTRRGRTCWYKKDEVGLIAHNDASILNQECYQILKLFFADKTYYLQLLNLMHEITRLTAYGQFMDNASNPGNRGPQFDTFTLSRYDTIVKHKTSHYSFVLPVRLAMYMSCITSVEEHNNAEEILLKIGHLFQMQDDFIDCWGDTQVTGKMGTDIQEGKCCWPIVKALSLANQDQLKVLKENYGKNDSNRVTKVKEVYETLNLKEVFYVEEEKRFKQICGDIENMKSKLNSKIFRVFLDQIYKTHK